MVPSNQRALSRRLAGAFVHGGDGGRVHASFAIGLVAVALTVAFLSLAFGIYDSYARKLETIALSVYPHVLVLDDSKGSAPAAKEALSNADRCARICAGETVLQDAEGDAVQAVTSVAKLDELRTAVAAIDPEASVAPIIFDEVDLSLETDTAPPLQRRIRVLGIDPTAKRLVPEVDRFLDPSSIAGLAASPAAVLVSESLGVALGLPASSGPVSIRAMDVTGVPHALEVVGTFDLGFHSVAENMVVTSLAGAQRLLGMPGKASYFGVTLEDPYAAPALRQAMRSPLVPMRLGASDWTSVARADFANIRLFRWILMLTLGMCLVITALGIRNTWAIVTVERRRQIGVLRALGLRDHGIRWAFLWIAIGLAGLGTVIGLPLGVAGSMAFGRWLDTALAGLLPIEGVRIAVQPGSLIQIAVLVAAAAIATALVAVRRALALDATTCLTTE